MSGVLRLGNTGAGTGQSTLQSNASNTVTFNLPDTGLDNTATILTDDLHAITTANWNGLTINLTNGDLNVDNGTLFVDQSTRRVGIGTTSPFGKLQVKTATDANFSFSSASSEASFELINDAGSANVPLNIRASEYKIKINSDQKVTIDSAGDVGIGTDAPFGGTVANRRHLSINGTNDFKIQWGTAGTERGYLYGDNTNLSLINVQAGYLRFNTNDTERMRIDSNGRIGVAVVNPGKLVDLQATEGLAVRFYDASDFKAGVEVAQTNGLMIGTSVVDDFCIRSQSNMLFSSDGNTERMRICDGGQVLINKQDPTAGQTGGTDMFQVTGTMSATGLRGQSIVPFVADGTWQDIIPSVFANVNVLVRGTVTGPGRHCSTVAFASQAFGDGEINMLVNSSHNNISQTRIEFRWDPSVPGGAQALQVRTAGDVSANVSFSQVSILNMSS